MSVFSISGLATGIDTASIISKLLDIERAPEKLLQTQQETYRSQSDAYTKLKTALSALQDAAEGMSRISGFKAMTSSVTDSSVLTATASSSAAAGTHTLQVNTLARNQRQVSTGYADGALFNTGSFTIDDGAGNLTTVDLADGSNTLSGIVSAINGSGANVTASIINDGSNSPNRLVITGKDTKNYTVDFSGLDTPPTTDGFPAAVPTLLGSDDPSYQAGTNASFTLDGVQITKTSNTVTDALPGVTLNLLKEGSTTDFAVKTDTDGVTKKINDFVSAYNSAINLINSQSKYDSVKKTAGVLSGDATLRTVQNKLQNLLTSTVSGVSGPYSNLAQLGLTTDKSNGTLSVDSNKLSTALSANLDGVVDLFTHNTGGSLSLSVDNYGIAQQFNRVLEDLVHPYEGPSSAYNGLLATRIQGLQKSITDIDARVDDMEIRIDSMQTSLQKQFDNMEKMVSRLQSQGNQLLAALGSSSLLSSSSSK